jgi:UPF0755 protein
LTKGELDEKREGVEGMGFMGQLSFFIQIRKGFRVVRLFVAVIVASIMGLAGAAYWWVDQPVSMRAGVVDVAIAPGMSARAIASEIEEAGAAVDQDLLYWWFRISGQSRLIKAGSYELEGSTTPRSLLRKLVQGDQAVRAITLVEGWTFSQVREALKRADHLRPTALQLSELEIMRLLGKSGTPAEGQFFPDTYTYPKGSTDMALLQRASQAMDKHLADAWNQRSPTLTALKTPSELLVLASIVEKETGRPGDRSMVASVFNNRLRIGMRLQTDPTVIYGMGAAFDGNLRKADLSTDTPWNTYTRAGLPPTPIAMPGKASLLAAANPAQSKALYFVARGDGTSQFSESLDAHNRAVNKYQRAR